MNDQSKKLHRKKRKTYNIEGHAHELTFSCYHQYGSFNDPKGKMSTRYRNLLLKEQPELFEKMCIKNGEKKVYRFWQAGGGFDRNLWNAKAIHFSINYIEANPVRTGLVENPEDWRWSSARAKRYGEGLMPDDFDIPILMK